MPTAIAVTSPDLVLVPPDGQAPAAAVLRPPDAQPLDDAVAQTAALLDRCGYVVALYPDALPGAYARRLHTIRSVLESDRMALLPIALPPLAVAVLACQLRRLSVSDLSPGVLACAARLLAHYIHAGAQLDSVAGLDRVEVGLGPHVKSWLPGTRFAVLAGPEPRLVPAGGAEPPAAPGFATALTVARGRPRRAGHEDWVTDVLAPAWRVQDVQETALPAESARWWGTRRAVEFAAAIPDATVLYQLVASVRREECRWCGLELIGDRCAFCSAAVERAEPPGARSAALAPSVRAALTSR